MRHNNSKTFIKLINGVKAVALICAMAFLCSCGSFQWDIGSAKDNISGIYKFSDLGINLSRNSEYISLDNDKNGIYGLRCANTDGHINYSFARLRSGQSRFEEILIGTDNTSFDYPVTDKNGNFYVLRTVYPYNPGLTNTKEDNAYKGKGVKKIVKYSPSGDEIWAGDITDKDASSYIKDMAYVKDSGILTYSAEGFSIYDEDCHTNGHFCQGWPAKTSDYFFFQTA